MSADLLKPLATFCTQSISQRYIKTVRNLGDAWRTLAEQPLLPEHTDLAVIETTFGVTLTIRNDFNSKDFFAMLDIPSLESASQGVPRKHGITTPPRHFRIFADYGTDFIWLNYNDPIYDGESSYIELEDALSGFPHEVFDNYDSWVEIYTVNFKKRCDDPGDYSVHVFPTVAEEVAWNVAGFLLAWRIALAPHVGSVELAVGRDKYLLKKGDDTENEVTYKFLENQAEVLAKKETVE
ncbi:uncharacterized protein BHQ10_007723 [Talaromyces amestolkiae]|uniref:Uncharacterized protein n=1 Tax=Talaromyces amestolkiae TaxID=1196081 RepID=A0A364L7P2_TALAM|nr:uncharacterized protein BHQ10_007723 [Talaromyces amestolkiae]RAO71711.1 hypothetical protein BHQ10_007723 [Talaromyces amestolkiae]